MAYDAVVDEATIKNTGFHPVGLMEGASKCDVFLLMNNHINNSPDGLIECLRDRLFLCLMVGYS